MAEVALKGKKDGYELVIKDTGSYDTIVSELDALLKKVQSDSVSKNDEQIEVIVDSGNRLLTNDQKIEIKKIIEKYSMFALTEFSSNAVDPTLLMADFETSRIHVITNVIRSGQEVKVSGDVLFLGIINQGGILKTSGSVFNFGQVLGTIHAGFPNNEEAIVVGDIGQAQQIRISDVIDIVDPDKVQFNAQTLTYINDLHMLDYSVLAELKTIKPKLFHKLEEK